MNVRELIAKALVEVGLATDAGSVQESDASLMRSFINDSILEFNMQDFLHFTKETIVLDASESSELILTSAPSAISSLGYVHCGRLFKIKRTNIESMPYYQASVSSEPRVFVYDRIYRNGAIVGRILLDTKTSTPLNAVVANNIKPFEDDSEVLCIPPEYIALVKADIQYKILARKNAPDELKSAIGAQVLKLSRMIKEMNCAGVDTTAPKLGLSKDDVFNLGIGRLP